MSDVAKDPTFYAVNYKKHKRTIVRPDGTKGVEKRPIQKSILMVDKAGNVCWTPLYTGPSQFAEEDHYKATILRAKQKAGWFIHAECPQFGGYEVQKHLPAEVRGRKPCEQGAKGGAIDDKNPCKCVLEVIKSRQAENALAMQAIEGQAKTAAQAQAELQAEMLEEARRTNAMLAEARLIDAQTRAAAQPAGPSKGKPGASIPDPMKDGKSE